MGKCLDLGISLEMGKLLFCCVCSLFPLLLSLWSLSPLLIGRAFRLISGWVWFRRVNLETRERAILMYYSGFKNKY